MLRQVSTIQRRHQHISSLAKPIRIMIVDDSALVRLTLHRYLGHYSDIEMVGQATNGQEMLDLVGHVAPDVIILDVEMPVMDGLSALEILMETHPLPVIMLSRLTWSGAEVTLRALELGAVDFVLKPQPGVTMAETTGMLVEKIRAVAHKQILPKKRRSGEMASEQEGRNAAQATRGPAPQVAPLQPTDRIVAIASSTGGPTALTGLLTSLPPGLPLGGVIVQHMPNGFTAILSQRLNRLVPYRVVEAVPGAPIMRGQFLIAPGGYHLTFDEKGKSQLERGPAVNGVRPSADVTFKSLVTHFGERLIAVVLTGMGRDGFAGAQEIHKKGGVVVAQDAASSVVYGMPRHVIDAGLTSAIGAPAELGLYIAEQMRV